MAYRHLSIWLEDTVLAIGKIKDYTKGISSADAFENDQMLVDATERNLAKIAEALKNAIKLEPGLPVTDIRRIIDLCNLINHTYFKVDKQLIWDIVTTHLPVLETEVRQVLEDYERRLASKEL